MILFLSKLKLRVKFVTKDKEHYEYISNLINMRVYVGTHDTSPIASTFNGSIFADKKLNDLKFIFFLSFFLLIKNSKQFFTQFKIKLLQH